MHASPQLNQQQKAQTHLKPSPQCQPEHKPFILYEDSLWIYFKMLNLSKLNISTKNYKLVNDSLLFWFFLYFSAPKIVLFVDPEENISRATITHS